MPAPPRRLVASAWFSWLAVLAFASASAKEVYEKDVAWALEEIPKTCAAVMEPKGIDWKAVTAQFSAEAKKVNSDEDHALLLTRLLARLRDGHAAVVPTEKTRGLKIKDDAKGPRVSPGFTLCRIGGGLFLKSATGAAAAARMKPGMELISVDRVPAAKWIESRIAELRDRLSFSTDQHAFFFATHAGLAEPAGTKHDYELKTPDGRTGRISLTFPRQGAPSPNEGPAFFPPGLQSTRDLQFGRVDGGAGYIHIRRSKPDLPEQIDEALKALADAPGLILDFRGNSGGGFDHEAFLGRFLLPGQTINRGKGYSSAGPNPYGGNVVGIIDGSVVSAGETGSGIFKEDGRGWLIGESPTAGMSSSKKTLNLPSGLFGLYVSVASNKGRFNGGKGIEGYGVPPNETVQFDPRDLAAGTDTLINRAALIIKDFPASKVPYKAK